LLPLDICPYLLERHNIVEHVEARWLSEESIIHQFSFLLLLEIFLLSILVKRLPHRFWRPVFIFVVVVVDGRKGE
jgi:hypothetical protein